VLFFIGVPFLQPRIGHTVTGGAAWHAGLKEGSEVVSVNGNDVFDFMHIPTEVALGDPAHTVVTVRDADTGELVTYDLEPKLNPGDGMRTIGVLPALQRDDLGNVVLDITVGSSAFSAGLRSGDRLVEVLDTIPGLSLVEQIALSVQRDLPLHLLVTTEEGTRKVTIQPQPLEQLSPPRIGIATPTHFVLDVRNTPIVRRVGVRPGDRILSAQGTQILRLGDLRLALLDNPGPLKLVVQRDGEERTLGGPALSRQEALDFAADIAIRQDAETTSIVVQEGEPAHVAGLRTGDRIVRVNGVEVFNWEQLRTRVGKAGRAERAIELRYERLSPSGAPHYKVVTVKAEPQPIPNYGLSLQYARYVYRSGSVSEAVGFGVYCSFKFLQDTWLTIKRMVLGDISTKSMGGIITIGAVSYKLAERGLPELFFFFCLLSINLAVINVLPIPVLDGGHLFFLIVEKIKGSPVSERVLGYSQMVGVVMILSLLVYVTYNDLVRWVFKP
jgi:regulator of sigma E protease